MKNLVPTIHLSGEAEVEVEKISKEISLVIQDRVKAISIEKRLEPNEQIFLNEQLVKVQIRTYLWVYLTLYIISNSTGSTGGNVIKVITNIPRTVNDAYEKILKRSSDLKKPRTLLQLIIVARWPLSLGEVSVALSTDESDNDEILYEQAIEPQY